MKMRLAVLALAAVVLTVGGAQAYVYTGDDAAGGGGFTALDGTWSHDNGSDQWDETGIGAGRPGGASALEDGLGTDFLRIQDTGDPRDYGMGDPGSNRKLYFGHSIDFGLDGASLEIRARIATDGPLDDLHPNGGGGISPWPAGGLGYQIHDKGKGNFGIREDGVGIISFSLANAGEIDGINSDAFLMNSLDGTTASSNVDTGEGTANYYPIYDATRWNVFTIDIVAGGAGTHQVTISLNGDPSTAMVFDVTMGSGKDFDGSYIAMGTGATPRNGAIDVDYFSAVPEPATIALLGFGFLGMLRRRRA